MVGGGKPLGDRVFAAHTVAGAAAISTSAVSVHPLDTVKTLLQLSASGKKQKMGLRQVVDRLMATSGPAAKKLLQELEVQNHPAAHKLCAHGLILLLRAHL